MSAIRNRHFGNLALILVLTFAWSYLIADPAVCLLHLNEAVEHHDQEGAELSVSNVSGAANLSPIESSHCDDIQIFFSMLVCTNAIIGPETDGLSAQAFIQTDIETGILLQVSRFLTPGSITDTRGDPEKLYLQNLSFLC